MKYYYLAIDQGTTGTTAVLVDADNFQFIDKENQEFAQIFPAPGLVEHNLHDIWKSVTQTIETVIKRNNLSADQILSIGITNQRETTCAFDKSGNPLANAIVWQDRRTADQCSQYQGQAERIKKLTGLPVDPYFSATKMQWFLKNNTQVQKAFAENNLLFGTIDTYLLYKLTQGQSFKTEASNASRTLLMNLETGHWDDELLNTFEVPKNCLPEICDSFGKFGETKNVPGLPDGIPITGILGDQQSALFGQAGYQKGGVKCTYGTGSFMLLNTGEEIQYSNHGLITTIAYQHQGKKLYALEGSCFIAGAAVQWLRDNLNIIAHSPEVEELAKKIKSLKEMEYVLFLPFFTGIGSPHWKPHAKAAIVGLSRDTNKSHIARACLEGMALSINDLITAMKQDSGLSLEALNVDGGAVSNNLLMEIQSAVSELKIIRPQIIETTAYGAALAAAIGANQLEMNKIDDFWNQDKEFTPKAEYTEFYQKKKTQWKEMLKKLYF